MQITSNVAIIQQLQGKHKVSKDTVRRLARQKDIVQKAQEKKEQNTKDMLEYMDSKKQDAMKFIDLALNEMMNPKKLQRSSVQALATSLGIIVDKFSPKDEKKENSLELFESIAKQAEINLKRQINKCKLYGVKNSKIH